MLLKTLNGREVPAITVEQMIEVDRRMIKDFGILLIQMMESAGRNLAVLTRRLLSGNATGKKVAVAVGPGNNGGGGMAAARNLSNYGAEVTVLNLASRGHDGAAARHLEILEKMGVPVLAGEDAIDSDTIEAADAVIDALVGYSLEGAPRGRIGEAVERLNRTESLVISLDTPTGLYATSGEVFLPCVKADATMTLALPKTGLLGTRASDFVGRLFLADISVPPMLYTEMGLDVGPIFSRETIIELDIGTADA